MDLALDHDQRLIVDTAERLLADAASSSATRAAADAADGIDRALWRQMAAMGWCGVHLPEAQGGLGLGIVELALLQEQLGRRLACVPFFDSVVLAGTLLREWQRARAGLARPADADPAARRQALLPLLGQRRVEARRTGAVDAAQWLELATQVFGHPGLHLGAKRLLGGRLVQVHAVGPSKSCAATRSHHTDTGARRWLLAWARLKYRCGSYSQVKPTPPCSWIAS